MTKSLSPWDRQKDENGKPEPLLWYRRFVDFLSMDPSDRSLLALYKEDRARRGKAGKPRCPPGAWSKRSKEWKWYERAEAYDLVRAKAEQALSEDGWRKAAIILGQAAPDAADALKAVMKQKHVGQKRLAADSILDRAKETATRDVHELSDETQMWLKRLAALAARYVPEKDRDAFERELEELGGEGR